MCVCVCRVMFLCVHMCVCVCAENSVPLCGRMWWGQWGGVGQESFDEWRLELCCAYLYIYKYPYVTAALPVPHRVLLPFSFFLFERRHEKKYEKRYLSLIPPPSIPLPTLQQKGCCVCVPFFAPPFAFTVTELSPINSCDNGLPALCLCVCVRV